MTVCTSDNDDDCDNLTPSQSFLISLYMYIIFLLSLLPLREQSNPSQPSMVHGNELGEVLPRWRGMESSVTNGQRVRSLFPTIEGRHQEAIICRWKSASTVRPVSITCLLLRMAARGTMWTFEEWWGRMAMGTDMRSSIPMQGRRYWLTVLTRGKISIWTAMTLISR